MKTIPEPDYVNVCWRCCEEKGASALPASEFIVFVCDLPPVPHSCGGDWLRATTTVQ